MVRVCVIGAGPCGMALLYQAKRMREEKPGVDLEVVCYEKQRDWGGLWNYDWKTGLDEYGEPVHGSMYKYLWSNSPKEASMEFPDYTFEDHFGRAIPSFPPREVIFDYLKGRWNCRELRPCVTFKHLVRSVVYDQDKGKFQVSVKDLMEDTTLPKQEFDFVVIASGHFSVPNIPHFPGIEEFPGRVVHSHDYRNAWEFKGLRLLVVGASFSGEDIALQSMKYGAKSVILSHRTMPLGFKWPKGLEERTSLTKLEGSKAFFKDGSNAEVDAIILCTGYLHAYPYLEDQLRLKGPNEMYNPNLYKGTVWTMGGNNQLLYLGSQKQAYSFTMFDAQACWAVKYIVGDIKMPSTKEAATDMKRWKERSLSLKDIHEAIDFQSDFVIDLATDSDYGCNLDTRHLLHACIRDKEADIKTYRDKSHASKFTGTKSPLPHTTWFKAMDDSIKSFLEIQN